MKKAHGQRTDCRLLRVVATKVEAFQSPDWANITYACKSPTRPIDG